MSPRRRLRRLKDGSVVPTGSLVFEWQRKGVGVIGRATGIPDTPAGRRTFGRIVTAADKLYERGRLDVLQAVKRGQVHPMQLLDADRLDRLHLLPTPDYLLRLDATILPWVEATANRHTRRNRLAVLRRLLLADPDGTLGTLPELVKGLRVTMAATPAGWNRLREQMLAFLRDTMGRRHPLYGAVSDLRALEVTPVRTRLHLTPEQFHAVLPTLGPAREAFWLLCLTGMNPKEAWEDGWEVDGPAVRIHGKKAKTRERVVPWLAPIARPTVSRDVLTWWLAKVGLSPYVARRSYSRWLEDSGIPAWRVRYFMGHAAGSMTEGYQRGDMTAYLVGDARLLRDLLSLPQPATAMERMA